MTRPRQKARTTATTSWCAVVLCGILGARHLPAEALKAQHPRMAPIDQYLISDRDTEIGHSAEAAPASAEAEQGGAIKPFKAHVSDAVLDDLRRRIAQTKWPDQLPDTGWDYGADIHKVRELADYWRTKYDWRAFESRLNQLDQFTTDIDGQQIHFIHVRSPRSDAMPLLLIHGWPGSIVEFLGLVQPLTNPTDPTSPAFHVVIPSLPGFGFSGPTHRRGWSPRHMATALVTLMDRLAWGTPGTECRAATGARPSHNSCPVSLRVE
jgi:hypothetical protein